MYTVEFRSTRRYLETFLIKGSLLDVEWDLSLNGIEIICIMNFGCKLLGSQRRFLYSNS